MNPDRLDHLSEQARRRTPIVGAFLRRRAAWRLWTRRSPDAVRRLAAIAEQTDDPMLRDYIFGLFDELSADRPIDVSAIDAVVSAWAMSRSVQLGDLIRRKAWVAREPLETRLLSAMYVGKAELLGDLPAIAVGTLLAIASEPSTASTPSTLPTIPTPLTSPRTSSTDVCPDLPESAKAMLSRLSRPDACEAVCDAFLDDDHPAARAAALIGGYEPANAARRAIFLFLTGQWAEYETLDFDGGFLRSAYEVARPGLRNRLAAAARAAGRMEHVAAAAREGRKVGEMTDVEWESAVAVLAGGRRWEDLWRLAQAAPPRWSAKMVLRLAAERWKPAGVAGAFLGWFVESARAWHDPVDGYLPPDTYEGHSSRIVALAPSPEGSLLVTSSKDRELRIWTTIDRRSMVRQIGEVATHLAISPDGRSLAAGQADGFVTLWGLPEGRQIARMPAHVGAVRGMATIGDANNARLVTVGDDARVRLWALPGGRELQTLGVGRSAITQVATFDHWICAANTDGKVMFWDVGAYGCMPEAVSNVRRVSNSAAVSSHLGIQPYAPTPAWSVQARGGKVVSLVIADGGRSVAAFAGGDVTLVRLPHGRPMHLASARVGEVTVATAVPGARFVCVGGTDGRISLVRAADGTILRTLEGHPTAVRAIAASRDGHLLATGGGEGSILLWGLPDGKLLATVPGQGGPIRHLLFNPVGTALLGVVGDDPAIRSWNVEQLRLSRIPLADMTLRDLQTLQAKAAQSPPGASSPAGFVAALLARRFEHDVLIEEVNPGAIEIGEFDIELG